MAVLAGTDLAAGGKTPSQTYATLLSSSAAGLGQDEQAQPVRGVKNGHPKLEAALGELTKAHQQGRQLQVNLLPSTR